jgi:colanic acid biosynthesis glycosyl transferase WcaI
MTDLARQLQTRGHEVTVLTTSPHYNVLPENIARQPMRQRWGGLLAESTCDGVRVLHVRLAPRGSKVFRRGLDFIWFHLASLLASLRTVGPYDIVLAPSPPLTMGVVAWLQGLLRRVPAVYNVQEIYPDFMINQGMLRSAWAIGVWRRLERFVYERSAAVVPISEWFARAIRGRGVPDGKLAVIPNFVDTELYQPLSRDNEFARAHGLVDRFTVLYGGNIGLSQDWASFLHAAETLADHLITFVVVGGGAREEWLKSEVARRGLRNVKLLGYQPRELMPLINASSDVGTIPMKATTTSDTFPSKIYTILACGKPAIVSADADSELAWLIAEARCGTVVPPNSPEAYTQAVLDAYLRRDALAEEGARGRAYVADRYSKEAVGRQYDALIGRLLAKA